jgi:hypothetical protein
MYGWRVTAPSSSQSVSRCHGKAEAGDCGGFTIYCRTVTLVSVGTQMRTDHECGCFTEASGGSHAPCESPEAYTVGQAAQCHRPDR